MRMLFGDADAGVEVDPGPAFAGIAVMPIADEGLGPRHQRPPAPASGTQRG